MLLGLTTGPSGGGCGVKINNYDIFKEHEIRNLMVQLFFLHTISFRRAAKLQFYRILSLWEENVQNFDFVNV